MIFHIINNTTVLKPMTIACSTQADAHKAALFQTVVLSNDDSSNQLVVDEMIDAALLCAVIVIDEEKVLANA